MGSDTAAERFASICARHGVSAETAQALWCEWQADAEAVVDRADRGGPRPVAMAAVSAGVLLLNAAAIWWIAWLDLASTQGRTLALALVAAAAFTLAAEVVRRTRWRPLDAAAGVVAAAYIAFGVAVAIGTGDPSGGIPELDSWLSQIGTAGTLLLAGAAVRWRYGAPLITGSAIAIATLMLAVFTQERWFGPEASTATQLAGLGLGALLVAAVATAAFRLDAAVRRDDAFWPALLADALAFLVLQSAGSTLSDQGIASESAGAGLAITVTGALVTAQGLIAGRVLQIGLGVVGFWVGGIVLSAPYGPAVIASVVTAAGLTILAAAVLMVRRRDLLARRRRRIRTVRVDDGASSPST